MIINNPKILILILLVFTQYGFSQKLNAVRLEVPSDIDVEQFHVEPIDKNGVLVFYESREINKEKKRKWYFGLFNTNLKQVWLKFVPLNDKIEFIESKKTNKNIYFLFKNINTERFEYGFYEIVIYNIKKQSFVEVSGSIPLKADVAGFDIIDNTACIALNLKKHHTDIVFVNLITGDVNPIHIDEDIEGYIEALYANNSNNTFYIAIKQNKDRRYITDNLFGYSTAGIRLSHITIENSEAIKFFRNYVFVPRNKNEMLIFGTYDIVTGHTLSFKDVEDNKEAKNVGLFFMKIKDGKQESLFFYDFMSLNNITNAVQLRNISTIKLADNTTHNATGNKLISASLSLTKPKILKTINDIYIFSSDAYNPYYKTETRMDYDFYGRPYPYTYNVFSGYNFYDVIVVGVSPDGKLLWSNDFAITDMLTYSTKRKSVVFADDNLVTLAYINNGDVISQIIEGPVDVDKSKMKIGTNFPQDRVTQDENSHIVKWYGNYYLIYGYQKLKNRTLRNQSTRVIFYANKITYR